MADFLANVLAQRRMAQGQAQAQQMMMYRLMQARAMEAQRQRQAAMQTAIQNRVMHQNDFSNQLNLENLRQRMDENRQRDADRARQMERLELNSRRGTLKQGYRWKQDNPLEQEIIPGGPEEARMRSSHAEDVNKLQSINNTTMDVVKKIDYILNPKNESGFTSNFGGYNAYLTRQVPSNVPGFERTADVKTALEGLENIAQTLGLMDIRGRTGQSVGSISEREWPILGGQLLKISPKIEEDTARDLLKGLRAKLLSTRNREMQSYQNEWGPTPFALKDPLSVKAQGPTGDDTPQGVSPEDWGAMLPEERALWQKTPQQTPPQQ